MSATTTIEIDALFDVLARTEGKAELIDGEIVSMSPTGPWPGYAAAMIFVSLLSFAKKTRIGMACTDGNTFRVSLPHRQSFSPDASYFVGESRPMQYYEGAPQFAVEVRSAGDDGPRAERQMAEKRADYFAAGTQVVWDVDLLSNDVVRAYRASTPEAPAIYRPGDIANAEPAVPGWTMPVHDLLPEGWSLTPSQLS